MLDMAGKFLFLSGWTEHCPDFYNRRTVLKPAVLNCPHTVSVDPLSILREVEVAVEDCKKGNAYSTDNISTELLQTGCD